MDSTNSKNFYLVPIFILLFSGLFFLNKVTKTTDTPFDHFIFLPITAGTFLLSLGAFLIQKNKKSILCDKKVFFFSYLFGLLDTLIFHSTIKMLVNGPIINIIHALLISCCITKFFYSIPTLNVSILLGVTLAFFSFLISLTDVHLRGIVRLRSVENIMISKKVDVYFTLLTILLTLRLYYTVRTELFSDNLLPLYNSFFSFIFSLFYFLCYFNLNYFFNLNISLTIILFMIVYFFFIRIFDGKKMIYGLLVTSVLFGLIYFIKNDWFEGNMLEKHVLMYHSALFGGIFLLGYCEKNLVFRRIAFTVWFIELVGF